MQRTAPTIQCCGEELPYRELQPTPLSPRHSWPGAPTTSCKTVSVHRGQALLRASDVRDDIVDVGGFVEDRDAHTRELAPEGGRERVPIGRNHDEGVVGLEPGVARHFA